MADSNAQLGISTNIDDSGTVLPPAAPIVDNVNDLGKDFGSDVETQVCDGSLRFCLTILLFKGDGKLFAHACILLVVSLFYLTFLMIIEKNPLRVWKMLFEVMYRLHHV